MTGFVADVELATRTARWRTGERVLQLARSRGGRWTVAVASAVAAVGIAFAAVRHFAATWPLSHGHPGLLVAVGLLLLVAHALKAYGWRLLFAANESPRALTLAAANAGSSVTGLALPGRFDDAVRIAIVRRSRACPAGVRALCLSLFMLALVDAAALAPLAGAAALASDDSLGVRAGLALIAAAGVAAAAAIVVLPRVVATKRLLRFRIGRWLSPRTTCLRRAAAAWVLVASSWLVRAAALVVLLGALGVGFSLPLALLVLSAGAAAGALPIGPAGAATHAAAGAGALMASGVGSAQALDVAVSGQALSALCGAAILVFAITGRLAPRLARWSSVRQAPAPSPAPTRP